MNKGENAEDLLDASNILARIMSLNQGYLALWQPDERKAKLLLESKKKLALAYSYGAESAHYAHLAEINMADARLLKMRAAAIK